MPSREGSLPSPPLPTLPMQTPLPYPFSVSLVFCYPHLFPLLPSFLLAISVTTKCSTNPVESLESAVSPSCPLDRPSSLSSSSSSSSYSRLFHDAGPEKEKALSVCIWFTSNGFCDISLYYSQFRADLKLCVHTRIKCEKTSTFICVCRCEVNSVPSVVGPGSDVAM